MKREIKLKVKIYLITILSIFLIYLRVQSEPITLYFHITDLEVTPYHQNIWFWTPDSIWGPVRSNDFIGIRYRPHFFDVVITSKERFILHNATPYFKYDPIFNARPFVFPDDYPLLRDSADVIIDGDEYMTRVHFDEEDGVKLYNYRLGDSPPAIGEEDSLVTEFDVDEHETISIDGPCEVHGVVVGRKTIYSTGDMWLIDDIRDEGSDSLNGHFDYQEMRHMLALVSERNIIIKDNYLNGREDGFTQYHPGRTDKHSIIINGSLIALNESFTFEHQNDDWEAYQGPIPDQRGIIHLTGSVAQKRRAHVYRSNHIGTGYRRDYHYDKRLKKINPPGVNAHEMSDLNGSYENEVLNRGPYTLTNTTFQSLTVEKGVEIILNGFSALRVKDTLKISGSILEPVIFRCDESVTLAKLLVYSVDPKTTYISNAIFKNGVEVDIYADSISLIGCEFNRQVYLNGNVSVENCKFADKLGIHGSGSSSVRRSVFENGIHLWDAGDSLSLQNNTIVGARREGMRIDRFRNLDVRNNIIAFNRNGIDNRYHTPPEMAYNDVYGNTDDDYIDCEAGEGSISVAPQFVDYDGGDYYLKWGSPCIDAGDPSDPRDADGSITEMGAHYYDHELTLNQNQPSSIEYTVTAYPNPFNSEINLSIVTQRTAKVRIILYNVSGRMIYGKAVILRPGSNIISFDDFGKLVPGIYFVKIHSDINIIVKKLLYLP